MKCMVDSSPGLAQIMKILGIDGRAVTEFHFHAKVGTRCTLDLVELVCEGSFEQAVHKSFELVPLFDGGDLNGN